MAESAAFLRSFILPSPMCSLLASVRNLIRNCTLTVGYSLGMVKIEAFYKFHFMHLAVRVCRTDHNDSIIARIACSFLLNKRPESHQKLHSDCGL